MGNQRGSVGIFLETIIVVVFIFVILFGVKSFNNVSKKADVYYPGGDSSTSTKVISGSSGVSITGKDIKQPAGISVGVNSSGSDSGSLTNNASVLTINYTDSGFVPSSGTLLPGARTVKFVNKSKSMMWPLSSAQISPALDSGYGINPGGVYSYTFPSNSPVTTYGFYNRLNMMHKGSIILK